MSEITKQTGIVMKWEVDGQLAFVLLDGEIYRTHKAEPKDFNEVISEKSVEPNSSSAVTA